MVAKTVLMKLLGVFSIYWAVSLALIMSCATFGSSPESQNVQVKTANALALVVNGLVPVLRDVEELEGDRAINAAPDKAAARKALDAIELKWKPIWEAEKAVQVTQGAWATAIEKGEDRAAAFTAVEQAFCKFKSILPPDVAGVYVVPVAGVLCPKEATDAGS